MLFPLCAGFPLETVFDILQNWVSGWLSVLLLLVATIANELACKSRWSWRFGYASGHPFARYCWVGSTPPTGYLHATFSPSVSMAVSHTWIIALVFVDSVKGFYTLSWNCVLLLQNCKPHFMVKFFFVCVKSVYNWCKSLLHFFFLLSLPDDYQYIMSLLYLTAITCHFLLALCVCVHTCGVLSDKW